MSKHTPGPWEVRIERGKHCIRPADVKQAGHTVGYAPLAKVEGDRRAGSQAENARTIATEPELLEALKDYVQVIAQAGGGDKQLFMAAIRAADKQLFMAAIRAADKQLFMAAIRAADKQPAPPSPKQRENKHENPFLHLASPRRRSRPRT